MWEELFFHVSKGELPPGPHFYYDEQQPLARLLHAIGASPELDGPLPLLSGPTWRRRWLEAFERHWPLDEADRLLHLAALESRLLARLRDAAPGPAARRIRTFLRTLGAPCFGPSVHDGLLRWLPGCDAEDWFDEALRLSAAHGAGGASYEVLFPGTWGDEAGLIRARLTRLQAPPDQPRVLLAAWSHYLLTEADANQLVGQFDELASRHRDRLGDDRFLLELLPLTDLSSFSPPTVAVEGQSLGLAVLLAAWAAGSQPSLMPLIATGQLLDGEVRGVGSVYEKSEVVRQFLEHKQPHRFLVPAENRTEVRGELETQFSGRVLSVARDVNALFAATDLLTDGCDGYRALLSARRAEWTLASDVLHDATDTFGLYDESDRVWLQEVAARAASAQTAATALAFGNDPRRAMRQVIVSVRGEGPIALPLWLAADAVGDTALVRLTWRVERGLLDVSEPPAVATEALRNLIGTFGDRLLLVAYGSPSVSLVRHELDAQRWRQLREDVESLPRRPRLLLLASDGHHLDRLCPEGGGVGRWAPAGA